MSRSSPLPSRTKNSSHTFLPLPSAIDTDHRRNKFISSTLLLDFIEVQKCMCVLQVYAHVEVLDCLVGGSLEFPKNSMSSSSSDSLVGGDGVLSKLLD